MVKQSWSTDKEKFAKQKAEELRLERIRQFNIIRITPAYTVEKVTSIFDGATGEPLDSLTMKNGDTYSGLRNDLQEYISKKIMEKVDEILGQH
jgi:hypothetical protein